MSYSLPPLDPDAAEFLRAVRAAGIPRLESMTAQAARALLAELRAKAKVERTDVAEVRDLRAPGAAGGIPLRLYRPAEVAGLSPCVVWLHGGGWVLGDLDTHDAFCRGLANAAGCVIVAVDYRLAPEHRLPAGLDDACAALRFVAAQAPTLGIDPARLAIGGDSAGGNFAAVMALMARDAQLPAIRLQVLLYPVLDCTLSQPSQALDADGLLVSGPTMVWFRDQYLKTEAERRDWRASPLLAERLSGVAPCFLVTAGGDPLCDEGRAYASRLAQEGVRLTYEHWPGQLHGFFTANPAAPAARRALATLSAALRAGLASTS
jgi:acetyl esterase